MYNNMHDTSDNTINDHLTNLLSDLEKRISRIEEYLNFSSITAEPTESVDLPEKKVSEQKDSLEFRIGELWLVRIGIIAISLGIIFLLTFPYQDLPSILPSLFGYLLVAGIFWLSYYWRESFSYISRYLVGGALLLLYFSTMRLHFFSTDPVLTNLNIEVLLLSIIVIINLYISIKRKSIYLTSINLFLGYVTSILSNQPYFIFTCLVLLSLVSVYFKLKYQWQNLIFLSIILTYFMHLIWFINNPFLGNELQMVSTYPINLLFILIYAAVFASGNLFRSKELLEDDKLVVNTILNCFGSFMLFIFITLTTIELNQSYYFIFASIIFLLISIVFWQREKSKYSTFFYCILGFMTLSVALVSGFDKPDFFIWLCWQSLLVAVAAIWFRSKIIITANAVIYILIFLAYLLYTDDIGLVSVSFGLVALLTARIINWQTHRLEIKTELMRNLYLSSAFIAFPYTLYFSIPNDYISLSWIAIALVYYLMSLILKNKKYRWMALLTLLLSVLYLFIIGIYKFEPVYRIISFLVLGFVLLFISIIYTRIRSKKSHPAANEN